MRSGLLSWALCLRQ